MKTDQFRIKLASGFWATGFIDVKNGFGNKIYLQDKEEFMYELVYDSYHVKELKDLEKLIDNLLNNTNHKNILKVYKLNLY